MDAEKERLLDGVRSWLEGMDTAAVQTEAEGEPDAPDLFTLLAELAALKNEVKLESRQVKGALDQFRDLFDGLQRANTQLTAELAEHRRREREHIRETERVLLLELLELRDRLLAGQAHAAGYRPGWLARMGGAKDFVAGITEGMSMNLRRLDGTLARRDVRAIEAIGHPFDPLVMSAVDSVEEPAHAPNQIVGEIRSGYLRGGELLRTAEVIVNKHQNT